MDQSTPKGRMSPAVEVKDEKRPWTAPVLKRLDVGLTSSQDDSGKPLDGGMGHNQHS
jgi:hypothetical protein